MAKLTGRVAIITGAASGIGHAIAKRYAEEGATVVIADYNEQGVHDTVAELEKLGAKTLGIRVNVADSASVQAMVTATVQAFGQIDILVNNAGIGEVPGPIHEKDETDWARVMAVNSTGPFLCMKYTLREMLPRKQGVIINLASIGGILGFPNNAAYAASKGAVIQLTRAAALEYASRGIRVNAIAPGWIKTPMVDQLTQLAIPVERLIRSMPIGRLGTVEEVAGLALFLASDDASLLQGAAVVIDGGLSIA